MRLRHPGLHPHCSHTVLAARRPWMTTAGDELLWRLFLSGSSTSSPVLLLLLLTHFTEPRQSFHTHTHTRRAWICSENKHYEGKKKTSALWVLRVSAPHSAKTCIQLQCVWELSDAVRVADRTRWSCRYFWMNQWAVPTIDPWRTSHKHHGPVFIH